MSEVIELSNGQSAVLRSVEAVTTRQRRPVEKALMQIAQGKAKELLVGTEDLSDEAKAEKVAASMDLAMIDQFNDLNDLVIMARLESWTFDMPISLDSLLDIPDIDNKKLKEAVANSVLTMLPSFTIGMDPNSPTPASNA